MVRLLDLMRGGMRSSKSGSSSESAALSSELGMTIGSLL